MTSHPKTKATGPDDMVSNPDEVAAFIRAMTGCPPRKSTPKIAKPAAKKPRRKRAEPARVAEERARLAKWLSVDNVDSTNSPTWWQNL